MREPCKTCFYKNTAGEMIDPCFPCLQTKSFWTGAKERMFDRWTDGKMTPSQVKDYSDMIDERIRQAIANDPEITRLLEQLAEVIL